VHHVKQFRLQVVDVALRLELLETRRPELQSTKLLSAQRGGAKAGGGRALPLCIVLPSGATLDDADAAVTPPESPRLSVEQVLSLETDPRSPWHILRAHSRPLLAGGLDHALLQIEPATCEWFLS